MSAGIQVTRCQHCGEDRIERDHIVACAGCGELRWPGGRLAFGLYLGKCPRFAILTTLLRRDRTVHSKALWHAVYEDQARCKEALRTNVWRLRQDLRLASFPGSIETEGHGYRLVLREQIGVAA